MPGSKVRAVENALVKIAHRGNELRKAQLLLTPPTGQVWTSYYFAGSARIATIFLAAWRIICSILNVIG